jgi:2-methylisocitrate lyase-like PEP mutase family enzyme
MQNGALSIAELAAAGVKRISLATALYRAAMTGLRDAAQEIQARGTFGFATRTMMSGELNNFMRT